MQLDTNVEEFRNLQLTAREGNANMCTVWSLDRKFLIDNHDNREAVLSESI